MYCHVNNNLIKINYIKHNVSIKWNWWDGIFRRYAMCPAPGRSRTKCMLLVQSIKRWDTFLESTTSMMSDFGQIRVKTRMRASGWHIITATFCCIQIGHN